MTAVPVAVQRSLRVTARLLILGSREMAFLL
jgi:hypothetical protein